MVLSTRWACAQNPHGEFDTFRDRLFTGGTFGLSVGSRLTQIDFQPLAGLWIFPQWNIGACGRYMYRSERFNLEQGSSAPRRTHILGISGFTQVLPIPDFSKLFGISLHGGVVLHAEYEALYVDRRHINISDVEGRTWVKLLFVGGGWRQRIGDRSAVNLLVLWNLNEKTYSPYLDNPILRFSFTF